MHASPEHFDVLIVGAGLSGVGAACHLQRERPGTSYAILEARDAIGGTWDLFRYPGIRSDSDMFTLGYSFKPWENAEAIADGPSIRSYIRETAHDGTAQLVRIGTRIKNGCAGLLLGMTGLVRQTINSCARPVGGVASWSMTSCCVGAE